ncbi:ABC transporter permease [Pandoraea apista]|uniref:ABC transporter permease n=1 Tax=Pandoraea apista TaxID=93218 RepID=UPI00065963D2|nr:ABC transporter permease [Pandoraea apista]ALS65483.1 polyamine ABC transporter permease [Pandoraea apista]RRW89700.1 ABC transporter permease [Pandoraea apista]RRW99872.1 ABC transporter permease [Pandoraea apista]CFB62752.1 Putrescine transport system permease protein PotH [Pandoraea apista]
MNPALSLPTQHEGTHRWRLAPVWMIGVPLLFFAAFFLAPLAVVLVASLTAGNTLGLSALTFANYARVLADHYHWDVTLVTFRIACLTTVFCVILGYPLAWYLVRIVRWQAWRRACVILLVVPMLTSNIVRSFGWMVLLGRNGLINEALLATGQIERPIRFLGTETGILIGMVYVLLPFVVLAAGNSLARVDTSLEQASADLGAKPHETFFHVTLPLTMPGIVAGAIMVFTLAVSAYVTPALLSGGRVTVLSMLIFQQYSSTFDVHYGGALSIVLLVFTLAMVAMAGRIGVVRGGVR